MLVKSAKKWTALLTPKAIRFKADFLLTSPVSLSIESMSVNGYAAQVTLPKLDEMYSRKKKAYSISICLWSFCWGSVHAKTLIQLMQLIVCTDQSASRSPSRASRRGRTCLSWRGSRPTSTESDVGGWRSSAMLQARRPCWKCSDGTDKRRDTFFM